MHNHYNQSENERNKREGLAVAQNLSEWQQRLTQDSFREMAYGSKEPEWLKSLKNRQQMKEVIKKATENNNVPS